MVKLNVDIEESVTFAPKVIVQLPDLMVHLDYVTLNYLQKATLQSSILNKSCHLEIKLSFHKTQVILLLKQLVLDFSDWHPNGRFLASCKMKLCVD